MPAVAVLDLDDPGIRIETDFARELFFDLRLRHRRISQSARESPVARPRLVKHGLRCRDEQFGRAIETAELDEDRTRLFGAAPTHRCKQALDVAPPDIGGHPDRGFQAHGTSAGSRTATDKRRSIVRGSWDVIPA